MPAHPILIDVNVDGRPVKAVVQMGKQAFAYVFDRTNGTAGVADGRAAGAADRRARREWTSPTQPFPIKPPAVRSAGGHAKTI